MLNRLEEKNLIFYKIIFSDEATFHCELAARWGPSPLSQGRDEVPEPNIPGKMDRSWRLHSVVTQITQANILGLLISGIRES
jgi:hypothetical protein